MMLKTNRSHFLSRKGNKYRGRAQGQLFYVVGIAVTFIKYFMILNI
jgi:hypothetical protein